MRGWVVMSGGAGEKNRKGTEICEVMAFFCCAFQSFGIQMCTQYKQNNSSRTYQLVYHETRQALFLWSFTSF